MIAVVSPGLAWVVSIIATPLGLDDDSEADVIMSGLTGSRNLAAHRVGLNREVGDLRQRCLSRDHLAEHRVVIAERIGRAGN